MTIVQNKRSGPEFRTFFTDIHPADWLAKYGQARVPDPAYRAELLFCMEISPGRASALYDAGYE